MRAGARGRFFVSTINKSEKIIGCRKQLVYSFLEKMEASLVVLGSPV